MEAESRDGLQRRLGRVWWAFRIGWWGLVAISAGLILIGWFVPGLLVGLIAAGTNIAWREWARKVQRRYSPHA